jgi:hypothetical protein
MKDHRHENRQGKGRPAAPPGARAAAVPGTRAAENAKGAPIKSPVVIDHSFVAKPGGGPEVKTPHGVRVKDGRTISKR